MFDRLAPVIFVLLWSTGWIVAKFASIHATPLFFLVIRHGLATLAFAALCLVLRARWPQTGGQALHAMVSGVLLHGMYLGGLWWAIGQGVPAGLAGIIAGLQPLMTAVAAPAMVGERLQPRQKLGLVLGFAGIALAVSPKLVDTSLDSLNGLAFPILINLLAMVAVTAGTLYQKRYLQTGDIRSIAVMQYLGAFLVTLPAAFLVEDIRFDGTLAAWAGMAWAVFGLSMGAVGLLLYLIRKGQVSRAAALIYMMPPLVALEAALIFGEVLTPLMIAGTAVVVIGIYLTTRDGTSPQHR